jgi:hypothetical protein
MIISDILTALAVVVLFVVWLYFPRTIAVGLGLAYSIIAKKSRLHPVDRKMQ